MPAPPRRLPYITIQPSYPTVQQEIVDGLHAAEDIWLSCYKDGSTSVHGRVRVTETDEGGAVELTARDGVDCELVSRTTLSVSCPALSIPPTPIHFASATPHTLKGGIDALAISPDGKRFVVGGKDGLMRVGELGSANGKVTSLKGHVADITAVKFFPSNEVVLSASLDMSIRVFSAIDGTNPRTLSGHTKAVTALHILGRGRQVLSGSLDGTIRLWNVAQATTVETWRLSQPVSAFAVARHPSAPDATPDDDLSSLVLIAAHTNGTTSVISLASPASVTPLLVLSAGTTPLESIALDASSNTIAIGSRNGVVSLFRLPRTLATSAADTETPTITPRLQFARSSGAVHSLAFVGSTSLLVAGVDGLPFKAEFELDEKETAMVVDGEEGEKGSKVKVVAEFAGIDCEAARVVVEREGKVWVAGADGVLRKYL